MDSNPLLVFVEQPYAGYIPFDRIQSAHFKPAFEMAFRMARQNLQVIIASTSTPTFENTIEAIEHCSESLNVLATLFMNLNEAHTNSELEEIAKIVLPQLADWDNDLTLNEVLFARVRTVYESKPVLKK